MVLMLVVGIAAAVGTFAISALTHGPSHWILAFSLALAGAIGELATISGDTEEGERTFSLATTVHLAAAMLLTPAWASLAAAAGTASGEMARRTPLRVTIFNASVSMISTSAAAWVFHTLHPEETFGWNTYPALAAAVLTYIPLNILPVGAICSAVEGVRWHPLSWLPASDLATFVMEGCLAAVLSMLVRSSLAGLFFPAPLLIAIFLSLKRYRLLRRETRQTLRALVSVIDARDPSTAAHSERVGELSARLGTAIGLSQPLVREVRWAGRLHDLGKLAVEDAVLFKPGSLDDDEWESMRRHPAVSAELLEPLGPTRGLASAVRFHHERHDGKGYYRVPADQIPLISSIITIVDAFDAMTTDRPYRRALSSEAALEIIERGAGAQFNPYLGNAFVAMMRGLPVEPIQAERTSVLTQLRRRLRHEPAMPDLVAPSSGSIASRQDAPLPGGEGMRGEEQSSGTADLAELPSHSLASSSL